MAGGHRAAAVDRLELVARDLATISRVRPEVGALLDDVRGDAHGRVYERGRLEAVVTPNRMPGWRG